MVLHKSGAKSLVLAGISRADVSLVKRWCYQLQPWILQHYSGTLNLEIRRMLANYLAETFESVEDIDWNEVAERPEFVGHTYRSLQYMFFSTLFKSTKDHVKLEHTEITLRKIADNANEFFSEKKSIKVIETVLIRQKQVIDYFEQYVKKHGIANFL